MYYRTFTTDQEFRQYTIEDLYNGVVQDTVTGTASRKTIRVSSIPNAWYNQAVTLQARISNCLALSANVPRTYTKYNIPKTSGGYREISAPNKQLKAMQRELYNIFMQHHISTHDAAYAYVEHRTCKDALVKHNQQHNKWYYKFDLRNFFPSCTTNLLEFLLSHVYPFCVFPELLRRQLFEISKLDGALPQGSPLSPFLSNMLMTSFDWAMHYSIKHFNGMYTRYADDLLISMPDRKELHFMEHIIMAHLPGGLGLNRDKSRCGSVNGHNFNLGLIINKDNKITLGYEKKMKLKAKINNFIYAFTNGNIWSIIDTQVLQGEVNYFKQIEPEYASFVIQRLETKHHSATLSSMFADIIAGRVR